MATNKNGKPIVLNGVGSLVLKQVRDGKVEVIKCGTLQDLKLSFPHLTTKYMVAILLRRFTSCLKTRLWRLPQPKGHSKMLEYINLFDTSFVIVSTYYIFSTVFYFLMWFFKRPLDNFIHKNSLQFALQLFYWVGFGFMYLHYYFVLHNIRENDIFVLYMLQIISTVIYVVYLMSIVLSKLRNKIPDMRN